MNISNNDPNKLVSTNPMTESEEKAEDEEIKSKLFASLNKSSLNNVNSNRVSRKRTTNPNKNNGVKIPGICPFCGSKLGTRSDKHGYSYTVCEKYGESCGFYFPYKSSHFI